MKLAFRIAHCLRMFGIKIPDSKISAVRMRFSLIRWKIEIKFNKRNKWLRVSLKHLHARRSNYTILMEIRCAKRRWKKNNNNNNWERCNWNHRIKCVTVNEGKRTVRLNPSQFYIRLKVYSKTLRAITATKPNETTITTTNQN